MVGPEPGAHFTISGRPTTLGRSDHRAWVLPSHPAGPRARDTRRGHSDGRLAHRPNETRPGTEGALGDGATTGGGNTRPGAPATVAGLPSGSTTTARPTQHSATEPPSTDALDVT